MVKIQHPLCLLHIAVILATVSTTWGARAGRSLALHTGTELVSRALLADKCDVVPDSAGKAAFDILGGIFTAGFSIASLLNPLTYPVARNVGTIGKTVLSVLWPILDPGEAEDNSKDPECIWKSIKGYVEDYVHDYVKEAFVKERLNKINSDLEALHTPVKKFLDFEPGVGKAVAWVAIYSKLSDMEPQVYTKRSITDDGVPPGALLPYLQLWGDILVVVLAQRAFNATGIYPEMSSASDTAVFVKDLTKRIAGLEGAVRRDSAAMLAPVHDYSINEYTDNKERPTHGFYPYIIQLNYLGTSLLISPAWGSPSSSPVGWCYICDIMQHPGDVRQVRAMALRMIKSQQSEHYLMKLIAFDMTYGTHIEIWKAHQPSVQNTSLRLHAEQRVAGLLASAYTGDLPADFDLPSAHSFNLDPCDDPKRCIIGPHFSTLPAGPSRTSDPCNMASTECLPNGANVPNTRNISAIHVWSGYISYYSWTGEVVFGLRIDYVDAAGTVVPGTMIGSEGTVIRSSAHAVPRSITLAKDEYVNKVHVVYAWWGVRRMEFSTNKGQRVDGGSISPEELKFNEVTFDFTTAAAPVWLEGVEGHATDRILDTTLYFRYPVTKFGLGQRAPPPAPPPPPPPSPPVPPSPCRHIVGGPFCPQG